MHSVTSTGDDSYEIHKHRERYYPPMTPNSILNLLSDVDENASVKTLRQQLILAEEEGAGFGEMQSMLKNTKPVQVSVVRPGEGKGAQLDRLVFVRLMLKHAFDGYKLKAWGANEVKPMSGIASDGFLTKGRIGVFIIDAIDTLLLMGLTEEYEQSRHWIETELTFDMDAEVSLFETTIRLLGGLLSIYALTQDKLYLDKAVDLGDRLYQGVVEKQIPDIWVNLKGRTDHTGGSQSLAELGSLHLEFCYLSEAVGDAKYCKSVENVRDYVDQHRPSDGQFRAHTDGNGEWKGHVTLGAYGDSFYEYLLKSHLLSGGEDQRALDLYKFATKGLKEGALSQAGSTRFFVSPLGGGRAMEHLACFGGGMFALGSKHFNESALSDEDFKLGADLTETCYKSYQATPTKLGPEIFGIGDSGDITQSGSDLSYKLRPETSESIFYMWRLTKDPKYREWGWSIVKAIEFQTRVDFGYAAVQNTWQAPASLQDSMPSFLLAETFKYLYLLFAADDLLPLDDWVFNTEAHPLPIKGRDTSELVNQLAQSL